MPYEIVLEFDFHPASFTERNRIERRLAIRAAKIGSEADRSSGAVGEKHTPLESQCSKKAEGPLRER